MYLLAINGSPRKNWNTAKLLDNALKGAISQGAHTEMINLYDLNFKGCTSCFACKIKNGKSYGKCAYKDDLLPVLAKIKDADAIILGSPIYFGNVTGEMKSFMERCLFPYLVYDKNYSSLNKNKKNIGFIYTMNVSEDKAIEWKYQNNLALNENYFERIFGFSEALWAYDTYQFKDYSKYEVTAFDEPTKAKIREEIFPKYLKKAYNMGERFGKCKI
jgi:multimeric flavodoxin WrbA